MKPIARKPAGQPRPSIECSNAAKTGAPCRTCKGCRERKRRRAAAGRTAVADTMHDIADVMEALGDQITDFLDAGHGPGCACKLCTWCSDDLGGDFSEIMTTLHLANYVMGGVATHISGSVPMKGIRSLKLQARLLEDLDPELASRFRRHIQNLKN